VRQRKERKKRKRTSTSDRLSQEANRITVGLSTDQIIEFFLQRLKKNLKKKEEKGKDGGDFSLTHSPTLADRGAGMGEREKTKRKTEGKPDVFCLWSEGRNRVIVLLTFLQGR